MSKPSGFRYRASGVSREEMEDLDRRASQGGCAACGMHVEGSAYHPWAACELFKRVRNGNQVEANLRAVVEYGMKAERAGVSLDRAMADIRWPHSTESEV